MKSRLNLAAIAFLLLNGCSEARSDIENLDAETLRTDAESLAASADSDVADQVGQIQALESGDAANSNAVQSNLTEKQNVK